MGREVRRVAPSWKHPVGENGHYKPLRGDEMPVWKDCQATHLQLYETASTGTPISPVKATPEALAAWLTENNISAYAGQPTSYEAWLMVCQGRTVIPGASAHEDTEQRQPGQGHTKVDAFDAIDRKTPSERKQDLSR